MDTKLSYDEQQRLNELLGAFFELHTDEFIEFEHIPVERRMSNRPDVNAFILLDRLFPGKRDLVCSAEHEQIWLDVKPYDLMRIASEDDLLDLHRCGVAYYSDVESLSMFV